MMKRPAEESPGEPQLPATILVMDDDECMRELFRLHLSNAGYKVLVAEDAIDAGHLLLQQHPDLILADIEMPFMDGLEFLRAVKADRATRSVPVIFVTVRAEAEAKAKKLGAARTGPALRLILLSKAAPPGRILVRGFPQTGDRNGRHHRQADA